MSLMNLFKTVKGWTISLHLTRPGEGLHGLYSLLFKSFEAFFDNPTQNLGGFGFLYFETGGK